MENQLLTLKNNELTVQINPKGAELTLNEWFAQCSGCGAFSVKIVDEGMVKEL